ncbi:sorting nexin-19-like [Mizuhopecten yessoensis]|uniref:Sorting nexin-19 n=1 Tax=Mizuhopecten yessoensis TaxID=6573 RepID=A0A210Q9S2_MIZYE|nr:sorting nexin-19-like [Mizuhopecten yessoensis]OWF45493.1 Sorting nexin-19 [Mizuhopecten yessoensis]
MDEKIVQTWGRIKDIYGYHNRFSSFQQIVIISLFVGFASIFYVRLLTVVFVYVLAVLASVVACHVLTSVQTNFSFGVSILLFVTKHEVLFKHIFRLVKLLKINYEPGSTSRSGQGPGPKETKGKADDEFHDAHEHDEDTVKNAELIMSIGKDAPMGSEEEVNRVPSYDHNMHEEDWTPREEIGTCKWTDEVRLFSCLVSKDFVGPWYSIFSSASDSVVEETHDIINTCFLELCKRFQNLDTYNLFADILQHYRQHLRMFQVARTLYKTQPRRRLSQRRLSSNQHLYASRRINSVEDAFEIKFSYHSAVWGVENEIIYFRSIVQILLSQLLSDHLHLCNTSYLLFVEIFTCNIFLPVIELLSDSDFLYECIINILSDEKVSCFVNDNEISESLLDRNLESAKVAAYQNAVQEDVEISISDQQKNTDVQDQNRYSSSEQHLPENRSHRSDIIVMRRSSSASSRHDLQNFQCGTDISNQRKDQLDEYGEERSMLSVGNGDHGNSLYCDKGQSTLARSCPSDLGIVSVSGISDSEDFSAESSATDDEDMPSKVHIYLDSEEIEVEKLEPLELPSMLFVDVAITDTETRQEMRSSTQYTLYHIQYEALYSTESNSVEIRTRSVKRRFREFVNLQARLEDNEAYRKSLKDVKGPRRWLSLPFGNMDKRSVESRRKSLETFLKSLIQKLDICNGFELKEFLAYEGDGHIAFVRKAPEISVPRIDKMFVKTMSDVFDKIGELSNKAQEVLPKLPGKKDNVSEDEEKPVKDLDLINVDFSESKVSNFHGKLNHYMRKHGDTDCPDIEIPTTPVYEDHTKLDGVEGTKAVKGIAMPTADLITTKAVAMPTADLIISDVSEQLNHESPTTSSPDSSVCEVTEEMEITTGGYSSPDEEIVSSPGVETPTLSLKDKLIIADVQTDTKHTVTDSLNCVDEKVDPSTESNPASGEGFTDGHPSKTDCTDEIALAEAVIDLAIQALQSRDCWVTRDRVVSLTKHLAGTALHRFLMMELDTLTSEKMCVFYIRKLRETLWPNGQLSMEGRMVKTDKQKAATKEQARRCLAEFFPDILKQLVGSEDYQFSMDEIIESMEHQKLNRNFMCTLLDHLIEKLFPETSLTEYQENLLK